MIRSFTVSFTTVLLVGLAMYGARVLVTPVPRCHGL
jgi:hypothetical protein